MPARQDEMVFECKATQDKSRSYLLDPAINIDAGAALYFDTGK